MRHHDPYELLLIYILGLSVTGAFIMLIIEEIRKVGCA